jgi:membrane protein implicated in regulation of membrane protease activity
MIIPFLGKIVFWHWWAFAIVLLIVETLAPGAFFMWMGVSAGIVGVILAFAPDMGWQLQVVVFTVFSVATIVGWRYYLQRNPTETDEPLLNRRGSQYVGRTFELTEEMQLGRDGNELAEVAAEKARQEGIKRPKLYAHSLYFHLMRYGILGRFYSQDIHQAGSSLRSASRRSQPDNELRYNTYFALELDVEYEVPEWGGQNIVLFSENTMTFTPHGMEYPGGRQTKWYLIR